MIDRRVFNRQIAILAEMHRYVLSAPTLDEYYALLSPRMTTEQFVSATRSIAMRANGYWPRPADFLPPVTHRLGVAELDAQARREGLEPPKRAPLPLPASVVTERAIRGGQPARPGTLLAAPQREPAPARTAA